MFSGQSIYTLISHPKGRMFSRTFAWICLNTVTPRKVCGSEKWLLIFFIEKATCQNRKKMRVGKNRRWGMAKSTWFNWKALQFNKFVSYLCLPFSQRWRQWQCFLTYSAWVFWEDEGGGKVSSFQYIFFHHLLASRVPSICKVLLDRAGLVAKQ